MITLHGTLDSLLPISTDSDVYRDLVEGAKRAHLHRYYVVEAGNHVDGLYDDHPQRLRPILPCYRAAFVAMERWVERHRNPAPNGVIPKPESGDVVNDCRLPVSKGRG